MYFVNASILLLLKVLIGRVIEISLSINEIIYMVIKLAKHVFSRSNKDCFRILSYFYVIRCIRRKQRPTQKYIITRKRIRVIILIQLSNFIYSSMPENKCNVRHIYTFEEETKKFFCFRIFFLILSISRIKKKHSFTFSNLYLL